MRSGRPVAASGDVPTGVMTLRGDWRGGTQQRACIHRLAEHLRRRAPLSTALGKQRMLLCQRRRL